MSLHPQVVMLLERAARSPLPPYYTVPPFVARRIYRDTRAALSPSSPQVSQARLLLGEGPVAMRAYRPASGGALDSANAAVNECSAALRRAFGKVSA